MRLHPRGTRRMQCRSEEVPVLPHGVDSSQGMVPDMVEGLLLASSAWTFSSLGAHGTSTEAIGRHFSIVERSVVKKCSRLSHSPSPS